MDIGDRIRLCLKQQNMKMKELSSKAKIPLSTLSDLINGKTKKLDILKAKEISSVLNCSIQYLTNTDLLECFGPQMKQTRESHGYTLETLSQKTKIPIKMLKELENTNGSINFFLLTKIYKVYDISIDPFLIQPQFHDKYAMPRADDGDNQYENGLKYINEERLPTKPNHQYNHKNNASNFMIITDEQEQLLIKKYRALNERGIHTINTVINSCLELSRTSQDSNSEII